MASTRDQAKRYLAHHRIPQIFEGLLSCLMLERPEDPVLYIEKKMAMIKDIGVENVNWETFISHMHPYRDTLRRKLIRDGSQFDKEFQSEEDSLKRMEAERTNDRVEKADELPSKVFQLTEAPA